MDFKGKITVLNQPTGGTSKNGNSWQKQELIIEEVDAGQYPGSIAMEIFGEERIQKFNVHMGDIVDVKFNSKATFYNGRCYNQHQIWSLTKISGSQENSYQKPESKTSSTQNNTQSSHVAEKQKVEDTDDLPF